MTAPTTQMLGQDALSRARRFVAATARPLDRALCAVVLDGGDTAAVLSALAPYQNADGGMGHALEADFRLDASSVLATTVGLQYAVEVGADAGHPIVARALRYLVSAWDEGAGRWPAVPAAVNEAPHAPWWHVDEATRRCGVEGTWANPSAEVVAYLWRFPAGVPDALRRRATDRALDELARSAEPLDLHDLLCWTRLAQALPEAQHTPMLERLSRSAARIVDPDPAAWLEYGARPLTLAPTPASPFASLLADGIERNLDWEIERQAEDGGWHANWSWAESDSAAWHRAEAEWAGVITVQTLRSLKAFGRLG